MKSINWSHWNRDVSKIFETFYLAFIYTLDIEQRVCIFKNRSFEIWTHNTNQKNRNAIRFMIWRKRRCFLCILWYTWARKTKNLMWLHELSWADSCEQLENTLIASNHHHTRFQGSPLFPCIPYHAVATYISSPSSIESCVTAMIVPPTSTMISCTVVSVPVTGGVAGLVQLRFHRVWE